MPKLPQTRPWPIVGAILLAAAIALLGALGLYRKVATFQPLGFQASAIAGQWQVTAVTDPQTALRPGDGLLLVDGNSASSRKDLDQRLGEKASSVVAVLRDGRLLNITYHRPPLDIDWTYLFLAATGIAYLIIGLYAFLHGRRRPAGLFLLWCLASAVVYLFTVPPGSHFDLLAKVLFLSEELARILLPPLTLHLFLLFPAPALPPKVQRRTAPFLYLPAAAVALLQSDLLLNGGRAFFGGLSATSVAALDRLELGLLVAFSLAALTLLAWQLLHHHSWEHRRQMQWIAMGLAGGYVPFLVVYLVPWSLGFHLPAWTVTLAVLPLALVPLTFAWAILRYKLWDLEVILRGSVSYLASLLLGVMGFSLLHLAIDRGLPSSADLSRSVLTFIAGLFVAGVMVPTQRRVKSGLERLQHRSTYRQRRALAALGSELLEERDLARLCDRLLGQLQSSLELVRVELYLEDAGRFLPVSHRESLPSAVIADIFGPGFWRQAWRRLAPTPLPEAHDVIGERLFADGFRYAFPLIVQHRPVGMLLASHGGGGKPLDSQELDLVRALLNQVALAVENARLVARLQDRLAEVSQLRQRSEQILDSSPVGIVVLDAEQRVVRANAAFATLCGQKLQALSGQILTDVLPVLVPQPGGGLLEVSFCDAQGEEHYLQLTTANYPADQSDMQVLVVNDVSERIQMQHELAEKERLAALGMLAAGVAHEVNTPITGISSYAQMLLADTPDDDPRRALLHKVEQQTFRAARIVNNLLDFARDRRHERRLVSLRRVVDEALVALDERLSHAPVRVDWQPPAAALQVPGNEGELQQVLVNLIANAVDALGEGGGLLTIRAERAGEQAIVSVGDDGPGIAAGELEKVFQPFYSTKLARGGTGLGLSISYQIVRRHGGNLRAESRLGEGSRFLVELPLADAAKASTES